MKQNSRIADIEHKKTWRENPFRQLLLTIASEVLLFSLSYQFVGYLSEQYRQIQAEQNVTAPKINFNKCDSATRMNCVIDGDTFYLNGFSIRVADIDTPETNGARCAYEENLGMRATRRLTELLNAGPFEVKSIANRDTDQYGRKLRTIHRNGQSLGEILVLEGLARRWDGRRHPWCN